MSEERILDMIGAVNDKYIREADPEMATRKKAPAWAKLAAMVVCLCLVWAIGEMTAHFNITENPTSDILPLSVSAAELGMEEYVFGVALPDIIFANSEKVIMYDFRGIYVYDISNCELVGFSDFRPIDMTLIQGSNPTFVNVNKDGTIVRFHNSTKKYVYDAERNETIEVDVYDEQFEEYNIKQLPYDSLEAMSEVALTYVGLDDNKVSLDLRYDNAEEIVRYKNLVVLIKSGDDVREYRVFK